MFKAPTGPVDTLEKALSRDLRNMPLEAPSAETARRMAQVLREISEAMRAADARAQSRRDPPATYWRSCS